MPRLPLALFLALGLLAAVGSTPMAAPAADPSLFDTRWKLVSVAGMPAEEGRREAFLIFTEDGGLKGSTGCNNLGAVHTVDGDQIAFGPIMTTRMYCRDVARTERALLQNLPAVARFVVDGNRLELLTETGAVVAVYEAATA